MDKERQSKILLNYKQTDYKYVYKHSKTNRKNNSLEDGTDQKALSLKYHRRGKSIFNFVYSAIKAQTTTDWLLYCVMPLNKLASTSVGQQILS